MAGSCGSRVRSSAANRSASCSMRLGDAGLRGVEDDGRALVHRLGHHDVARDRGIGLDLQRPLDLADVELHLGVGPVEDQVELRHRGVEQPQGLQPDLHVLDVRDVHARDEQHVVADLDQAEDDVVEVGRRVDDDVVGEGPQQLDDADHLGGADLVGERRLERRRQHVEPGGIVPGQQVLQERAVEPVERADGVDDGVLRRQLEHHGDVAELEVGVDQHDRSLGRGGPASRPGWRR